jgi:DNA (cytosine-5)-methyltransferase 1
MTVGSLFSGIGGFDLAFGRAGFDVEWSCEIEAFPRKALAKHWPDVPCYQDVREIGAANVARVDVLVGGFPCQDLSVAGKRGGLDGARSGLFFEFMRIAGELQPEYVVIENVPGLLSSASGRDFAVVLDTLEKLGYGWAYRILDSQHFGVAQRRRRVFIVGCLGGQFERAASVLFEPEGGGGDSAAGHEAGARTARGVTDGVGFALRSDPGGTSQAHNTNYVAATLRGRSHGAGVNMPGRGGEDDQNLLAYTLRNNQRDTSQGPGNYVAATLKQRGRGYTDEVMDNLQVVASSGERERALTASMHKRHDEDTDTLIAFGLRASDGHHGHSSPRGDGCDNLVAAALTGCGVGTCGADDNQAQARHLVADTPSVGANQTTGRPGDISPVPFNGGVRRLTPLECERLQNFPDGWTCLCGCQPYTTTTCKCPDSPRYRALGNAVTVSVVNWIAQRIEAIA